MTGNAHEQDDHASRVWCITPPVIPPTGSNWSRSLLIMQVDVIACLSRGNAPQLRFKRQVARSRVFTTPKSHAIPWIRCSK
jgi:hypothetical protein